MSWGYIKISRKAYAEDPFWRQQRVFSKWEAWEDMIQTAAFKQYRRIVRDGYVELERGEILASMRFLADRWQWGIKRVRGFLSFLQKEERISAQRETQHGTVYLLMNYNTYQTADDVVDTPKGTPRAHQGHTKGTNKEDSKKDNKIHMHDFAVFWDVYPRRAGNNPKASASKLFAKRCKDGVDPSVLIDGAKRYCAYCDARGITGTEYVLMAQTWLGDKTEGWTQDWTSNNGGRYTPDLPDLRTFGQ